MKKKKITIEDVLADHYSGDNLMEIPSSSGVFKALFVLLLLVVLIIFIQIINLGVLNASLYERLALANTTRVSSEPAPRGLILDRYGEIIVGNNQVFRAYLSPEKLPDSSIEREKVILKISEVLLLDVSEIKKMAEEHDWRFGRLILESDLSHEQLVRAESVDIPGFDIESAFKRAHISPFVFSHIAGYIGSATKEDLLAHEHLRPEMEIGKMGLELFYDNVLRGERGEEVLVSDVHGRTIEERRTKESKPGSDLETFLDKELQEYFYIALGRQIINLGSRAGAGIIMNPNSGEVLAIINVPSFDNNRVADFLNMPNSPFLNRVVAGRYSPGSIIKPLVATAVLSEGLVSPRDNFFSSGRLVVENPHHPDMPSIFHDWRAHGWVDLYSSLALSSNVYYYIVGGGYENQEGLGISRLNKWWRLFGLNEASGIDIPSEKTGLLPDPTWKQENLGDIWRLGDTYNVSIGQGDLQLTPIALINYINAIANKGIAYKPRVASVSEQEIVIDMTSEVDEWVFDAVHKGMVDAVTEPLGTAHIMNDLPFGFAGKTGSAQVSGGDTNAFFVGYGFEKDLEISIFVMIEGAREGGLNVVPVARDVLLWYYENRVK